MSQGCHAGISISETNRRIWRSPFFNSIALLSKNPKHALLTVWELCSKPSKPLGWLLKNRLTGYINEDQWTPPTTKLHLASQHGWLLSEQHYLQRIRHIDTISSNSAYIFNTLYRVLLRSESCINGGVQTNQTPFPKQPSATQLHPP